MSELHDSLTLQTSFNTPKMSKNEGLNPKMSLEIWVIETQTLLKIRIVRQSEFSNGTYSSMLKKRYTTKPYPQIIPKVLLFTLKNDNAEVLQKFYTALVEP